MKPSLFSARRASVLGLLACFAFGGWPGISAVRAQTSVWTGATGNSWGTPGNWNRPPAFDGTDQLLLSSLVQPSQVLGANRAIRTLTFNQGGFTVTGNALTLNNSGAGIFSTGNNTIGSDLYPQVPVTYQSDSGTLSLTGVVIANSAYYPAAPAAPTLTGAGNFTISGSIQGAGGLMMNGTGTLLLSGTNYNAGALTINSGTLKLAAANTIANNGALIVNSGGTFDLNGLNPTVTYLNGTGSISLGANTLTLTAAGSYASPSFTGTISGSGGVVVRIDASGTQTLGGNNTYTGGTVIKSGLVAYNADANLGAAASSLTLDGGGLFFNKTITVAHPITVGSGGALFSAGSNVACTFNPISGNGPVTYGYNSFTSGNNVWTPAGGCTYTGTTNVQNGTLVITDNTQLGAAGNAVVPGGGTVLLRGGITIAGRTITPGNGAGGSANTLGALAGDTGDDVWAGPVTVNSSGYVGAAGGATLTLSGPISGSGSLIVLSLGDTFIRGTVTGAAISKNNGGTLTLSGSNASGGAVFAGAGTLVLQGGNAIADTVGLTVASGATVRLQASETVGGIGNYGVNGGTIDLGSNDLILNGGSTFAGVIGGTGRVLMEGSGTLNLSGTNTFSGGLYIDAGTLVVSSDAAFGAPNNPVVFRGGTFTVYGDTYPTTSHPLTFTTPDVSLNVASGTFTLGQALTHPGSFTKLGAGTLVLTGTNSYTGGTVLSAGTLSVASDASLGANGAGLSLQSGTLQVTGNAFHSTPRPMTTGAGYTGFDIADPANTFTLGTITGSAGGITKLGAGTLVLAAQTTLGTVNTNVGTLRFGASNILTANCAMSVSTGATLDLAGFDQTAADLGVSGTLTTGAGTLSVSNGISSYSPGGLISGRLALSGSNVTVFSSSGTGAGGLTIAAAVSGSGTLTSRGPGALVLAGDNPFAGTTVVNAGTLRLTGSLLQTVAVTVAQGAVLEVAGGRLGVNGNLTNNGVLRLTGSATLATSGTITNNGVVDVSRWNGALPANIVNGKGGIILDAAGLQITQIARSTAAVQVTVNGLVGLSYQLQRATNLTLPDWQVAGTSSVPQAATANGAFVLTDNYPLTASRGFYRVVVSQSTGSSGH